MFVDVSGNSITEIYLQFSLQVAKVLNEGYAETINLLSNQWAEHDEIGAEKAKTN